MDRAFGAKIFRHYRVITL